MFVVISARPQKVASRLDGTRNFASRADGRLGFEGKVPKVREGCLRQRSATRGNREHMNSIKHEHTTQRAAFWSACLEQTLMYDPRTEMSLALTAVLPNDKYFAMPFIDSRAAFAAADFNITKSREEG